MSAENERMRQVLLEHLTNVLNGCMQELGYFPGIAHQLHRLQQDFERTYADNVNLSRLVNLQKDTVQMLNAQIQPDRDAQVEELAKQVETLTKQLEKIERERDTAVMSYNQMHVFQHLPCCIAL